MFKKVVFAVSCLGCCSVYSSETFFKNPEPYVIISEKLDDFLKQVRAQDNMSPKDMYDAFAQIRSQTKDPKTLEVYNVIQSFLRNQTLDKSFEKIVDELTDLIEAMQWLLANEKKEVNVFNKSTNHLPRLMKTENFIHLSLDQMRFCIALTEKIKDAINIASINNENGPEDGSDIFLSNVYLEKELLSAKQIVESIESISKNIISNDTTTINTKDDLQNRLEKLTGILNGIKKKTIIVKDKKLTISKNIVRYFRRIISDKISEATQQLNKLEFK